MGLKECEIELDNQWNTYYAGQTINGRVKFTFDSPKTIRGMCCLCLFGTFVIASLTVNMYAVRCFVVGYAIIIIIIT